MAPPVTLGELTAFLETIAPLHLQESYDNAGLLTGHPAMPVTGVMVALDMLEPVVEEARSLGCNVVVAHHPIIFRGLKSLTGRHYVERVVIKAIREEMALYAIHTNLDSVLDQGVNAEIGSRLGLTGLRILKPKAGNDPGAGIGMGAIGELPTPLASDAFFRLLKEKMHAGIVRHTAWDDRPIRRVAVCGGAGSFLLPDAVEAGADALVTADFKYHEFFEADGRILVADIGHYETEACTIDLLHRLISRKFRTFATHSTTHRTNPVNYS